MRFKVLKPVLQSSNGLKYVYCGFLVNISDMLVRFSMTRIIPMSFQITGKSIIFIIFSTLTKNETVKLCIDDLLWGNPPVTGEFSSQRSNNAERASKGLSWLTTVTFTGPNLWTWRCPRVTRVKTARSAYYARLRNGHITIVSRAALTSALLQVLVPYCDELQ